MPFVFFTMLRTHADIGSFLHYAMWMSGKPDTSVRNAHSFFCITQRVNTFSLFYKTVIHCFTYGFQYVLKLILIFYNKVKLCCVF